MKRILSLCSIILLLVLLGACGREAGVAADYRYVEEKTAREATTALEEPGEFGERVDSYTAETGESFFLYCRKQDAAKTYTVTGRAQADQEEEIIPLNLENAANYCYIRTDKKGNILLADTAMLYVFPKNGQEFTQSIQAWAGGGMLLTEDNSVICQTYKDTAYYIFDLTTGAKKGTYLEKDFLFEQGSCQPFLYGDHGEELLVASGGIYEHTGDSWELRVPASGTSMAKSGFSPREIEKKPDGTYVILDDSYQYVYCLKETGEGDTERQITLRVTAWQDRSTLKNALTQYQIENPNVTIEYTFRCSELPQTRQEANILLQKTNAELVSSQAADLYVLDHLPWKQYQEKGFLMDLSEIVKPYAEKEEYFGNILTAYETEDGLYAVPWFFSPKFVLCREELVPYVQSIHDLAAYLEAHPEDPGVVPYYYRDMPEVFLAMMYDYYRDDLYENGTVSLEDVKKFLESAGIIYDRQQGNPDATVLPDYSRENFTYSLIQQSPCRKDMELFYTKGEGSLTLIPGTAFGVHFLVQPFYYEGSALVPIEGFHSHFLLGVNAQTEEKEAAVDLLQFLLSYYEVVGEEDDSIRYEFDSLPGIPIYKTSLRQDFAKRYGGEDIPMAEGYPMYIATEEDTEKLIGILSEFHTASETADATTNDEYAVFQERSLSYLTGEKTLEEAADEVYNGLKLLYEEKQGGE